jgi:RNA polymerase sigma-70 factor (ECF subfamily)
MLGLSRRREEYVGEWLPEPLLTSPDVAGTTIVSVVVEEGRVTQIFAMRNPHKLDRLDEEAELSR